MIELLTYNLLVFLVLGAKSKIFMIFYANCDKRFKSYWLFETVN